MLAVIQSLSFDCITTIPLSDERQTERGFNQSTAFVHEAGLQITDLLIRLNAEKQSKKTRQERLQGKDVFQISGAADLRNQTILLIDDIYNWRNASSCRKNTQGSRSRADHISDFSTWINNILKKRKVADMISRMK